MPKYKITLDISGTAQLTIWAQDEEDAADIAENFLSSADLPKTNIDSHKVDIEIGEAMVTQIEEIKNETKQ